MLKKGHEVKIDGAIYRLVHTGDERARKFEAVVGSAPLNMTGGEFLRLRHEKKLKLSHRQSGDAK